MELSKQTRSMLLAAHIGNAAWQSQQTRAPARLPWVLIFSIAISGLIAWGLIA